MPLSAASLHPSQPSHTRASYPSFITSPPYSSPPSAPQSSTTLPLPHLISNTYLTSHHPLLAREYDPQLQMHSPASVTISAPQIQRKLLQKTESYSGSQAHLRLLGAAATIGAGRALMGARARVTLSLRGGGWWAAEGRVGTLLGGGGRGWRGMAGWVVGDRVRKRKKCMVECGGGFWLISDG